MTDAELIEQILKGNPNAFRLLVQRYEKLVLHMVFRVIQHHEEAEDVCQDVFIKIYKELKSYRKESKLSTWIATVAYRTSINHIKKNKSIRAVNFDNLEVFENAYSSHRTPEKELLEEEMKLKVREMIMELPVNYRTALTLYHLEEFTYAEIGSITGMPEGTVKSYLFRARNLLAEKLKSMVGKSALLCL